MTVVGRRLMPLIAAALVGATVVPASAQPSTMPAVEAIRRAIVERMGDVEVNVREVALPDGAPEDYVAAVPDPGARLGRPIRVTLVPATGRRLRATATLEVRGTTVVAARDLARGATLEAADVECVEGVLVDVPIRRLPTGEQAIGSRVLRPVPAGGVLGPGSLVLRRAVKPGDRVTAIAIAGAVQVSAELEAADGGDPGDVIRVVNRETRRSLRGRVIGDGTVEVGYAR